MASRAIAAWLPATYSRACEAVHAEAVGSHDRSEGRDNLHQLACELRSNRYSDHGFDELRVAGVSTHYHAAHLAGYA